MLKSKIISSLEKVFVDQKIEDFTSLNYISALKGERLSLQFIYAHDEDFECNERLRLAPKIHGELSKYATIRSVRQVAVNYPAERGFTDDQYLRTTPGLYPDLLSELNYDGKKTLGFDVTLGVPESLWIEFDLPDDAPAGLHPLVIEMTDDMGNLLAKNEINVEIINATLGEQKLIFTQWIHCDSLAEYYNLPAWSERHWEIIENYAKEAVRSGV